MVLDHLAHKLRSITAIPITPFTADGHVDWAAFQQIITRMVRDGIQVITPNGNTSKFYALGHNECKRAVEVAAEAVPISELPDSEQAEVAAILAGWGHVQR